MKGFTTQISCLFFLRKKVVEIIWEPPRGAKIVDLPEVFVKNICLHNLWTGSEEPVEEVFLKLFKI